MGDTLPPQQEGACLGRSVTSWTNVSASSPACSTARRWRPLCDEFGISRKTGYKIYDRYKDDRPARADGSQPPTASPRESAADGVEKLIVRLKKEYPSWGAPKIRERLRPQCPTCACPAISTVHAVLDRHGLVPAPAPPPAAADRARRCRSRSQPNRALVRRLQGRVPARQSAATAIR